MFLTKLRFKKSGEILFSKEMGFTSTFHCFDDISSKRYVMKLDVRKIKKLGNIRYVACWSYSNYPLTPSGIFYNLSNRISVATALYSMNKEVDQIMECN